MIKASRTDRRRIDCTDANPPDARQPAARSLDCLWSTSESLCLGLSPAKLQGTARVQGV